MARVRTTATTTTAAFAGLALAAALGFAAPAAAQPSLEQTGDGYQVVYGDADRGAPAGGRAAVMEGGGDNAAILYTGPDTKRPGTAAMLSGGGDAAVITYAEPAPATNMAAGTAPRSRQPRG
jgi:hypothetical protein